MHKEPWIASLDPVRRDVLYEMAFNLGVAKLQKFKNTLSAVRRGDYEAASAGMLASLWATQTGSRAQRLAKAMKIGVRA